MKHSLQLKMGQGLTMTPALQQAISLLQLSSQDLHLEIQTLLDSNIMLEQEQDISADLEYDAVDDHDTSDVDGLELDDLPENLELDCEWDDVYDVAPTASAPTEDTQWEGAVTEESLDTHLYEQLLLCRLMPQDMLIAHCIIDGLDHDGYLAITLDEVMAVVTAQFPDVEMADVLAVLELVQRLDPLGVATKDLRDCLRVQAEQFGAYQDDTQRRLVIEIVSRCLGDIPQGAAKLARQLNAEPDCVAAGVHIIQSFHPKPGRLFDASGTEYIKPDVFVSVLAGRLKLQINPELAPKLRVNAAYNKAISTTTGDDAQVLKGHLQEARWFIKSLQARNETLMKVAASIVEKQRDYFFKGEVALKPLVLRDIAEKIDMHESTVSRVTSNKYMHTPQGLIPFKYFFSSHVGTADGGECSAVAIQAMIKKMVAEEPANKPLSDNKIATQLQEAGINVARRTVAKYREALNIPPSHERKSLA